MRIKVAEDWFAEAIPNSFFPFPFFFFFLNIILNSLDTTLARTREAENGLVPGLRFDYFWARILGLQLTSKRGPASKTKHVGPSIGFLE